MNIFYKCIYVRDSYVCSSLITSGHQHKEQKNMYFAPGNLQILPYKNVNLDVSVWSARVKSISCPTHRKFHVYIDLRCSHVAYLPHYMYRLILDTYPGKRWGVSNKIIKLPKYSSVWIIWSNYMIKDALRISRNPYYTAEHITYIKN